MKARPRGAATRRAGADGMRRARGASPSVAALLALSLWAAAAGAQTVRDDFYSTNGTVNAVVRSGNTLYIGGSFSAVGPPTGGGVPIDGTTGIATGGFPKVLGQVAAIAADGAG